MSRLLVSHPPTCSDPTLSCGCWPHPAEAKHISHGGRANQLGLVSSCGRCQEQPPGLRNEALGTPMRWCQSVTALCHTGHRAPTWSGPLSNIFRVRGNWWEWGVYCTPVGPVAPSRPAGSSRLTGCLATSLVGLELLALDVGGEPLPSGRRHVVSP